MLGQQGTVWQAVIASSLLLGVVVSAGYAAPLGVNSGTIERLTASGAVEPGDPIHIEAVVRADSDIQRSNLYYQLVSPSGAVLTVRKIDANKLTNGELVPDEWDYLNPPETGEYLVTLCWSTGSAQNCDIDYAETLFESVPSLVGR